MKRLIAALLITNAVNAGGIFCVPKPKAHLDEEDRNEMQRVRLAQQQHVRQQYQAHMRKVSRRHNVIVKPSRDLRKP